MLAELKKVRTALILIALLTGCGSDGGREVQVYDISASSPQMVNGQAVTNITMTVQVPSTGQHRMQATYSESMTRGLGDSELAVRTMDGSGMPVGVQLSETYGRGTLSTRAGSVSYQANADGTFSVGGKVFGSEDALVAALQSDPALADVPIESLVATSTAMDVLAQNNTQMAATRGFWGWIGRIAQRIIHGAACSVISHFGFKIMWCSGNFW